MEIDSPPRSRSSGDVRCDSRSRFSTRLLLLLVPSPLLEFEYVISGGWAPELAPAVDRLEQVCQGNVAASILISHMRNLVSQSMLGYYSELLILDFMSSTV